MSDGFVEQAGAVVFRTEDEAVHVLIVRARRNPTDWIFPKGHIEEGESAADAAVREAEEEAGVTGRVVSALWPAITFDAGDKQLRVQYFLVEFVGEVQAKEKREIAWLAADAAVDRLSHATARALLTSALEHLPQA